MSQTLFEGVNNVRITELRCVMVSRTYELGGSRQGCLAFQAAKDCARGSCLSKALIVSGVARRQGSLASTL